MKGKILKFVFILSAIILFESETKIGFTLSGLYEVVSSQHTNDIVNPLHHHFLDCCEEEVCFLDVNICLLNPTNESLKYPLPDCSVLKDLPSSIWQPPKQV